jgi:hypothetical protein
MGSLRPSRSDAEIRHGSFSHRLVVGRPKSHEAGRSVEVMWLVELVSSHTIAGCRKQNGPPLTEAAMAAPIVGENSIGMRLAWRSFQAAIRRSASSSTFGLSDSEILHFVQSTGAPATFSTASTHFRRRSAEYTVTHNKGILW